LQISDFYTLDETSISSVRQKIWSVRFKIACALKKAALPPTTKAFVENVKRAHLQACVWKRAIDPEPPSIKPTWLG